MKRYPDPSSFTPDQLSAMREWVCDCAADSYDLEERELATAEEIIRYTARNYDGGLPQFLADSIPVSL